MSKVTAVCSCHHDRKNICLVPRYNEKPFSFLLDPFHVQHVIMASLFLATKLLSFYKKFSFYFTKPTMPLKQAFHVISWCYNKKLTYTVKTRRSRDRGLHQQEKTAMTALNMVYVLFYVG